jgi:hypothetical protein
LHIPFKVNIGIYFQLRTSCFTRGSVPSRNNTPRGTISPQRQLSPLVAERSGLARLLM